MPIRIGINGFGRIGRLVCRIASENPGLEIAAVNDLVPADNLAYLLKYDTMHRQFMLNGKPATISATENSFTINGKTTKLLNMLGAGDAILDVVGPLGKPSEMVLGFPVFVSGPIEVKAAQLQ